VDLFASLGEAGFEARGLLAGGAGSQGDLERVRVVGEALLAGVHVLERGSAKHFVGRTAGAGAALDFAGVA